MNAEPTLALAFLAGLSGAGHCWAMCGGIAGGAFMACPGQPGLIRPHLGYHAGRVLAYTLLGGTAAGLGQAIVLTGGVGRAQGVLYVLAGTLVVLAGLKVTGLLPPPQATEERGEGSGKLRNLPPTPFDKASGQSIWWADNNRQATADSACGRGRKFWPLAGFLNGLMPCALVFSLTLKAASAPTVWTGAAWLFAFGLGTVPAMALASALAHGLGRQSLPWLRRAAGVLVIALGLQAVWAGAKFFHVMLHL